MHQTRIPPWIPHLSSSWLCALNLEASQLVSYNNRVQLMDVSELSVHEALVNDSTVLALCLPFEL